MFFIARILLLFLCLSSHTSQSTHETKTKTRSHKTQSRFTVSKAKAPHSTKEISNEKLKTVTHTKRSRSLSPPKEEKSTYLEQYHYNQTLPYGTNRPPRIKVNKIANQPSGQWTNRYSPLAEEMTLASPALKRRGTNATKHTIIDIRDSEPLILNKLKKHTRGYSKHSLSSTDSDSNQSITSVFTDSRSRLSSDVNRQRSKNRYLNTSSDESDGGVSKRKRRQCQKSDSLHTEFSISINEFKDFYCNDKYAQKASNTMLAKAFAEHLSKRLSKYGLEVKKVCKAYPKDQNLHCKVIVSNAQPAKVCEDMRLIDERIQATPGGEKFIKELKRKKIISELDEPAKSSWLNIFQCMIASFLAGEAISSNLGGLNIAAMMLSNTGVPYFRLGLNGWDSSKDKSKRLTALDRNGVKENLKALVRNDSISLIAGGLIALAKYGYLSPSNTTGNGVMGNGVMGNGTLPFCQELSHLESPITTALGSFDHYTLSNLGIAGASAAALWAVGIKAYQIGYNAATAAIAISITPPTVGAGYYAVLAALGKNQCLKEMLTKAATSYGLKTLNTLLLYLSGVAIQKNLKWKPTPQEPLIDEETSIRSQSLRKKKTSRTMKKRSNSSSTRETSSSESASSSESSDDSSMTSSTHLLKPVQRNLHEAQETWTKSFTSQLTKIGSVFWNTRTKEARETQI